MEGFNANELSEVEKITEKSSGYLTDIPYERGYFPFQSPVSLNYVAAFQGLPPKPISDPFTYLELGCGNAHTLVTLAASLPQGRFYGVDLNAEHIDYGEHLVLQAGVDNVTFHATPFAELLSAKLPKFDFITLHGVYSWVSEDVRLEITRIIDAFLQPDGLVFVSYDALPGVAAFLPIREIFRSFTENNSDGSLVRFEAVRAHLKYMHDNDAPYAVSASCIGREIENIINGNPTFLAHQYFTSDPRYFSEVAEEMSEIGLSYVCRATIGEGSKRRKESKKFRELIAARGDYIQQEAAKSLILNEGFRRDVYAHRQPDTADSRRLEALAHVIVGDAGIDRVRQRFSRGLPPVEAGLVATLGAGRHLLGEARSLPEMNGHSDALIISALRRIINSEDLRPLAKPPVEVSSDMPDKIRLSHPLNQHLLDEYHVAMLGAPYPLIDLDDGGDIGRCCLSSPVTGDGVWLRPITELFVKAALRWGHADDLAARVDKMLLDAGKSLVTNKEELTTSEERRAYLTGKWERYYNQGLPALLRLGVVEPV